MPALLIDGLLAVDVSADDATICPAMEDTAVDVTLYIEKRKTFHNIILVFHID